MTYRTRIEQRNTSQQDFLSMWNDHSYAPALLKALCQRQALSDAPGEAAPRTGTYVGCMFTDYMALVRDGHGRHHTGAIMTGAPSCHP
jgi:hypothetical protein